MAEKMKGMALRRFVWIEREPLKLMLVEMPIIHRGNEIKAKPKTPEMETRAMLVP